MKKVDLGHGKVMREKFKVEDGRELYDFRRKLANRRAEEKRVEEFLISQALQYLEEKKKRLRGERTTIRQFVSNVYHKMVNSYPDITKERFPHITYGTNKESETYKKSYPQSFKIYFFRLVKGYFMHQRGLKRIKNPAPTFILSGGKRCLIHIQISCPEDCKYATFNQKVSLRTQAVKRFMKDPISYRSRVWRRKDFQKQLDQVLMLTSE